MGNLKELNFMKFEGVTENFFSPLPCSNWLMTKGLLTAWSSLSLTSPRNVI